MELLFCCQQKVVYNLMDHPVQERRRKIQGDVFEWQDIGELLDSS